MMPQMLKPRFLASKKLHAIGLEVALTQMARTGFFSLLVAFTLLADPIVDDRDPNPDPTDKKPRILMRFNLYTQI